MPTSDIATAEARVIRFLRQDERLQFRVRQFGVWYPKMTDQRGEGLRNLEFHGSKFTSAERHGFGEPGLAGLLVFTIHILCSLSHRGDGCVKIDSMPGRDFVASDGPRCPGFYGAE